MELKVHDIIYGISENAGSFFAKQDSMFAIVMNVEPLRLFVIQSKYHSFHMNTRDRNAINKALSNIFEGKQTYHSLNFTSNSSNLLHYDLLSPDRMLSSLKVMTPTSTGYLEALSDLAHLNGTTLSSIMKYCLDPDYFHDHYLSHLCLFSSVNLPKLFL